MILVDEITESLYEAIFKIEEMGFKRKEILIAMPQDFNHRFSIAVRENIRPYDYIDQLTSIYERFMDCKIIPNYQYNIAVYHPEMLRYNKEALIINIPTPYQSKALQQEQPVPEPVPHPHH